MLPRAEPSVVCRFRIALCSVGDRRQTILARDAPKGTARGTTTERGNNTPTRDVPASQRATRYGIDETGLREALTSLEGPMRDRCALFLYTRDRLNLVEHVPNVKIGQSLFEFVQSWTKPCQHRSHLAAIAETWLTLAALRQALPTTRKPACSEITCVRTPT